MPNQLQEKTVLAFDFGLRRIGVAIGQTITKDARPLTVLQVTDGIPKWEEIESLISTWCVTQLVVGLQCRWYRTRNYLVCKKIFPSLTRKISSPRCSYRRTL